jgi:hypothetical protein
VPRDRERVLELDGILRVNPRALLERERPALVGRALADRTRAFTHDVIADEHSFALIEPV